MSHDHSASLEDQFKHFLATTTEARADGKITFAEIRHIGSDLATFACTVLNDLGDPIEGAERLIQAAEKAFDAYIEPLDITGIPAGMEKIVDKAARSSIRPTIQAMVAVLS